MATYRVSYVNNDSYSSRGEYYISNVLDEYDAIDVMCGLYNLPSDTKILSVDFICE